MGLNTFFRQHFSQGQGILGQVLDFTTPGARLVFDNNLFGYTTNQAGATFNCWIYPTTTDFQYIVKIGASGNNSSVGNFEFSIQNGKIAILQIHGQGISNFGTINTNQWNHIVMSTRAGTVLTQFGTNNGATFDMTTKRTYNSGTGYLNDFHLMLNGTKYSRYIDPNRQFFQNDFATGNTGTSATFGNFFNDNQAEGIVITSDNVTDTKIGADSNGNNDFQGHMFQLYGSPFYTGLGGLNDFRNTSTGGSKSPLPHTNTNAHLFEITGGDNFMTGHNTTSNYNNINVLTSTLSKP